MTTDVRRKLDRRSVVYGWVGWRCRCVNSTDVCSVVVDAHLILLLSSVYSTLRLVGTLHMLDDDWQNIGYTIHASHQCMTTSAPCKA